MSKKPKAVGFVPTPEEDEILQKLKGDMSNSDFIRLLCRTSSYVQSHTQREGKDAQWVFRERKHGGKREGAGRTKAKSIGE